MNQKKNDFATVKEPGFTLVEVIVAVAIISFAIFATLRVITASLNSITRQGQRVKALHLAQAHLAKLEAESFSKVVPETWIIDSGGLYRYQLSIYDSDHPFLAVNQFIDSDFAYWYLPRPDGLGFDDDRQDKSDGILVADKDGTPYIVTDDSPPPPKHYNWDSAMLTLTFSSLEDPDEEIQIYYRYYHLVHEGGTVPSSGGEGLKEKVIKLCTDVGDTNDDGKSGEKDDILGEDLTAGNPLSSSDYDSFNPETKELTFVNKEGNSVRIYYLPLRNGQDPAKDSIIGIVKGELWGPGSESKPPKITPTTIKQITVTEYWKQGNEIKSTQQETYITR